MLTVGVRTRVFVRARTCNAKRVDFLKMFFNSKYLFSQTPQRFVESEDIIYKSYYLECTSTYSALWRILIYSHKGLLLAFGMFLAWQTRHVTVDALNDSRYIGLSVYNVVIPCAMGITILNTVELSPDSSYAIESVLSVVSTTITLCLVFIPKVSHKVEVGCKVAGT